MMEMSKKAYTAWQDEQERERLLMEQLPQVRYIARRIHERLPRHVPFEDLVHAGVVGHIGDDSRWANVAAILRLPAV